MSDTLYIVMPAYNEAENIASVVEQWHPVVSKINENAQSQDSKLVIFNDGSKDDTLSVLQSLEAFHPYLQVVDKPNSGHGATLIEAYEYALSHGADFVFQTDSDGQTDPDEFWAFWESRDENDMVIGARSERQDGFARVVIAKVLRFVVKRSFGVECEDVNTSFRLMSAETLQKNLAFVPRGFNLTNVLLTVVYTKQGQRIKYIPITFKQRQGGVNSINVKSIIGIGKQAVKDFRELNATAIGDLHA